MSLPKLYEVHLSVRIPRSLAERLKQHEKETLIPVPVFVRFALESALQNPVIEAEKKSQLELPS